MLRNITRSIYIHGDTIYLNDDTIMMELTKIYRVLKSKPVKTYCFILHDGNFAETNRLFYKIYKNNVKELEKENIEKIENEIALQKYEAGNKDSLWEFHNTYNELLDIDTAELEITLVYLQDMTRETIRQIDYIEKIRTLRTKIEKNTRALVTLELHHNLLLRAFEFQSDHFCKSAPDDIMNLVREYIGCDFFENVRQSAVKHKYYGSTTVQIHDTLEELLYNWRVRDLKHYCEHFMMKYDLWEGDRLTFRKRDKKQAIVEFILQSNLAKYECYELLRDVYLLEQHFRHI
jgi:hypothetical protein